MEVWPEIEEAISEAVRAGVYRRAARYNPKTASVWDQCAKPHSSRVAALLEAAQSCRNSEAQDRNRPRGTRTSQHGTRPLQP